MISVKTFAHYLVIQFFCCADVFHVKNQKPFLQPPLQLLLRVQQALAADQALAWLPPPPRFHPSASPTRSSPLWRCKSLKLSATFVVVGSLLSSLPWPLRPPPPSPRPAIREKTPPRPPPHPLEGLSLISMPLGLLHRLLPNKHRQDLLQCLLHFVCCAHLPRAIHLPPFLFFLAFALSPCSWSFYV